MMSRLKRKTTSMMSRIVNRSDLIMKTDQMMLIIV